MNGLKSNSSLRNSVYNDMRLSNNQKKLSFKNFNHNSSIYNNTNGGNSSQQGNQLNLNSNTNNTNFSLMMNNTNSNQNFSLSNFKDLSYNEEYYDTLSRDVVLPIINQTGAFRLLKQINQNHNASVSSTTGQFLVRILLHYYNI